MLSPTENVYFWAGPPLLLRLYRQQLKERMAYTRDPNAVFEGSRPFPAPLSHTDKEHTGKQPVCYEAVRLLQPLGDLSAGAHLAFVEMDWLQGQARVYEDAEDRLNGVGGEPIYWRFPARAPETADQYIFEVTQLLRRGHSLLRPQCTCRHNLSPDRCLTLGISAERHGSCPLETDPKEFSAKEVSLELGLDDVCSMSVQRIPLVCFLEKHCRIRVDANQQTLFFSSIHFFLGPVR